KLVGFSWADAERGVLLAGIDFNGLVPVAAAVTGAALRRRKTVLVLDPAGRGEAGAVLTSLAAELGVPVQEVVPADGALAGADGALAAAAGRAIRTRSAILAAGTGSGAPLISDAADVLAQLRELGLHADCLLWVSGCEAADPSQLADLLDLAAATGTVVLASTTSAAFARAMAARFGLTVKCGRAGEFTMTGHDGVRTGCRMVPALALTSVQ
ncbi:MAG: hypothetical protein J2P27_09575, partial [Actinobacteria bacterium]|nr:hypothetical protein [Actinomycetota bacterium]